MPPTKKFTETEKDESAIILHLVTPQSQGKPLCGETSPDAAIGSYSEHLDEDGEWCREVFGKGGKLGKACEACLALYPSLLRGRPKRLSDSINLQAVITVSPYPQSMTEEFSLKGICISDDFIIEPDPIVIGQYLMQGKVALTVMTHIIPKKPGKL